MTENIVLDPEKQKQAKEYARIRRCLWQVDTIFSAVYALLVVLRLVCRAAAGGLSGRVPA